LRYSGDKNLKVSLAVKDFTEGLKSYKVWLMFGWLDIKLRYRRSLLGPFWITITVGVMVASLGILYSQIFNQKLSDYVPYLGCGLIFWFFISGLLNESCTTFKASESQIKQVNQPMSMYAFRLLWRNIIIFLHNFIIVILILVIFSVYNWSIIIFPLTFALVSMIFFFINIILGLISARYRDVPQIVLSITQISMFLTPIFWRKEFLTKHEWVTLLNPLFHMLELLRNPILGNPFPFQSLYITLGILVFLIIVSLVLMTKFRNRIAYWV
jgi:ABC-type polysaccharide/polyol phosphate export permease